MHTSYVVKDSYLIQSKIIIIICHKSLLYQEMKTLC